MRHNIHSSFISFLALFFLTGCDLWITPIEENENGQTLIHVGAAENNTSNGDNIIGVDNVPEDIGLEDFRVEIEGKDKEHFIASVAKENTTFYISILPKDGFTVKLTKVFDFNATVYILEKPSCSKPISITLAGSNHAPVPVALSLITDENMPMNFTLIATDQDREDVLEFNITKTPSHGTLTGTTPNLIYTPNTNYSGIDSFSYFVSDGYVHTDEVTMNIVINKLVRNHPPTIEGTPNTIINEDDIYNFTPISSDVDVNDTLFFTIENKPRWANFDVTTGALTGTPTNEDVGVNSGIIISVSDGLVTTPLPVFTIEVINVNNAPIATANYVNMLEDTNESIILHGTDIDVDARLTYHLVDTPVNGKVTIIGNIATYIPDSNYFGTDGFTFEVKDEFNATSNVANIDINISDVEEPNTAPIAREFNISMDSNTTSITFDLNASDVDGDTLTYIIVDSPAYGSLIHVSSSKTVEYNRNSYTGNTSFTYQVNDSMTDSNIARVYIESNVPNTPPVAYDKSVSLVMNVPLKFGLDANDTDGDTLTYRIVKKPSFGTLIQNTENNVTYSANSDYTGNDSFTFVANDGTDDSNEALVHIEVGNVQLSSHIFAWCNANDVELWATDGTSDGTVMVKDIRSNMSSAPESLVKISNTYFFVSNDGLHGKELWKTQGTQGSTVLVKDIKATGKASASPHNLIDINGTLFFAAKDEINGIELWKSDGTTLGTTMVKNINPKGNSKPENLNNVNGVLYFTADNGKKGRELWRSDGSVSGTQQVNDINSKGSSNPQYLTNVNGVLYFSADDGKTLGRELWYYNSNLSDQVSGYTNRGFFDISPGSESSSPINLFNYNGVLVFSADDGTYGYELWRKDSTGVSMYPNFAGKIPFQGIDANPHAFTSVGSTLYFSASEFSTGYNLRVLDDINDISIDNAIYTDNMENSYLVPQPENLLNVNDQLFSDTYIVNKDQEDNVIGESIYVWSTLDKRTNLDAVLANRKALHTYDILNNELLFRTTKTDDSEELWISNMGTAPTFLKNGCKLP